MLFLQLTRRSPTDPTRASPCTQLPSEPSSPAHNYSSFQNNTLALCCWFQDYSLIHKYLIAQHYVWHWGHSKRQEGHKIHSSICYIFMIGFSGRMTLTSGTNEYANSQVFIIESIICKSTKKSCQVMSLAAASSRSSSLLGTWKAN